MPEPFRKPEAICQYQPELETIKAPEEVFRFIDIEKKRIQKQLKAIGVFLRFAQTRDAKIVKNLIDSHFNPQAAGQLSHYDVYNAVRYGYSIIAEDAQNRFVGCKFSLSYVTPQKISHSFVAIVKPEWSGKKIGALISRYSSLLGMERNGRVRRASCHPNNFASLKNLLNYVGYVATEYHPELFGKNEPRFLLSFPLSPAGINNNVVDIDKTLQFINTHQAGTDYRLIPGGDLEQIARLYTGNRFRIMAILPPGSASQQTQYLAMPIKHLHYPDF